MYSYAKDGITVALILDSRKEKQNGLFPVKIRVTYLRVTVKKKTQYTTRAINKRMTEICKQLCISHISTYTERHNYATVLKRSGVNIAYISESLDHNSLQTTETYLASFEKEEQRKNTAL